jgi:hypothetical protein
MAHEKWQLSYAGKALPPPDENGITLELQPVDNAERNANGDLMIEEVALKIKVSVQWSKLNGEAAHTIMSTLKNNRSGSLTYYDIAEGEIVTKPVYYGAGAKGSYVLYDDDLKAQRYSALTVSFIEV